MTQRASLNSLVTRLATKPGDVVQLPAAAPAPAPEVDRQVEIPPVAPVVEPPTVARPKGEGRPSSAAAKKDERVQILVRATKRERRALHQIALNSDTTVQDLVEEAIRALIKRNGGLDALAPLKPSDR